MAGTELTRDEILALFNEERQGMAPEAPRFDTLVNAIYEDEGAVPEGAVPEGIDDNVLVGLINTIIGKKSIVAAAARIVGIRTNEAIVSLINSHNPYTSDEMLDMTIYTGNPDFEKWADNKLSQIEVEIDGPYTTPKEWYFKGLPQQVTKALRIKYRYRAKNLGTSDRPPLQLPHWVTAYMLVGYEDGGA